MRDITRGVSRRPRARRRDVRGAPRHDPRAGRRERRRQVHADEGPERRLPARQLRRRRSRWTGREQRFAGIRDSERAGIAVIHQELALVRQLTIAENIFLGAERRIAPRASSTGRARTARHRPRSPRVGLRLDPATRVVDLGVGSQQLVEIAQGALARGAAARARRAHRGAHRDRDRHASRASSGNCAHAGSRASTSRTGWAR